MSMVLAHPEITPQRPLWLAGAPGFEPGNVERRRRAGDSFEQRGERRDRIRAGPAQPRRLRPYGSRTRSGQGRHRRSPAARDWNCSSLRCPRRVAGSVPEARASQSLAHRPLHPLRNGLVAFSDDGLSLITAWLQVRVLPAPPRSPAQLEFSPSPRNTLDFPRFGPGALARSRSL
jgi:hypothetical protein